MLGLKGSFIMPRDLDLDFEFQDDEVRERPVRSSRPATHRGG